jgi:hypothetical protein
LQFATSNPKVPRINAQGHWPHTTVNSERAVEMSVFAVRAFVHLRESMATNRKIAGKLEEMESRLETHDTAIQHIIHAIKELMAPDDPPHRKIGFQLPPAKKKKYR